VYIHNPIKEKEVNMSRLDKGTMFDALVRCACDTGLRGDPEYQTTSFAAMFGASSHTDLLVRLQGVYKSLYTHRGGSNNDLHAAMTMLDAMEQTQQEKPVVLLYARANRAQNWFGSVSWRNGLYDLVAAVAEYGWIYSSDDVAQMA
jgi:hypothetical protein